MKRIFALLIIGTVASCGPPPTPVQVTPIVANETTLATARNTLTVGLNFKDPAAAQFRNERVYRMATGGTVVCGEVNGKNSFGAYVGFKPYYVRLNANGQGERAHTEFLAQTACQQAASGTLQVSQ
ncbi:hypothetical protein [Pseudaestuariivita rosea]|uniref:hypothetical protein n=1 Tax=Pseudaestuariivita rosea TaxID=2763263 RepID=UPI001ABB62BE|nr:hypothetical protein [Pseudaestuariivita rosea]